MDGFRRHFPNILYMCVYIFESADRYLNPPVFPEAIILLIPSRWHRCSGHPSVQRPAELFRNLQDETYISFYLSGAETGIMWIAR